MEYTPEELENIKKYIKEDISSFSKEMENRIKILKNQVIEYEKKSKKLKKSTKACQKYIDKIDKKYGYDICDKNEVMKHLNLTPDEYNQLQRTFREEMGMDIEDFDHA